MLEEARAIAKNRYIRLPRQYNPNHTVDLVRLQAYAPLLQYLQERYPDYRFQDAAEVHGEAGDPLLPHRSDIYRLYTHVMYNGFQLSSELNRRTRKDRYCLARMHPRSERRDLVFIRLFLRVRLTANALPPLDLTVAMVDVFDQTNEKAWPWADR